MKQILDADIQAELDAYSAAVAERPADYEPLVMYAIYREDLDMPVGKTMAQAGHCYLNGYLHALAVRPEVTSRYRGKTNGKKAVMYARNLNQIVLGYRAAQHAGIPCKLIIDMGPEMPEATVTGLIVGPALRSEAHPVTKRFTFVRG